MRLIDGEALFDVLYHMWGTDMDTGPAGEFMDMINNAPTITPESLVRHGMWQGSGDGYADGEIVYDTWECSECGRFEDTDDPEFLPRFCPHCGAKMDLEE